MRPVSPLPLHSPPFLFDLLGLSPCGSLELSPHLDDGIDPARSQSRWQRCLLSKLREVRITAGGVQELR